MEGPIDPFFREQLLERRSRLEAVAAAQGATDEVVRLLGEIDTALRRLKSGTFGFCETCAEPVETDRLLADPLTRFCLDHLSPVDQRALQRDLDLAARIQRGLLPKPDAHFDGWNVAYRYQPAGPVSGDFCDLVVGPAGELYFMLGDVAGKGVAAAMLMSHLSAMVRTLISVGLSLDQLMERVSRLFCESTLPTHYATLVCGRASPSGEIEICNAGHPPPIVVQNGTIQRIDATSLPIGMFCTELFPSRTVRLDPGATLLLYSDGLVDAENPGGDYYGIERVAALAGSSADLIPEALLGTCLRDVLTFRRTSTFADDLTMLALRRA